MLICITEKCRMGCSHCMDDARADLDKFMTRETFKKAIEFNSRYDNSFLITGGEPTLHKGFKEIVNHCVARKGRIDIVTNGEFVLLFTIACLYCIIIIFVFLTEQPFLMMKNIVNGFLIIMFL